MKKSLKSKKIWIVLGIATAFLVTCGVVVYAANGFSSYKKASDDQALTRNNWNSVIQLITTVANNNGMVSK